jgi:SSS family solute:Na+ symporter
VSGTAIILVELLVYLLAVLYLGYRGWRAQGPGLAEFFVAGRTLGPMVGFLTWSATLFSAFTLVGLPGFFYIHGIGSWPFIAFADTFMGIFFYVIGRRLWRLSRERNLVTPVELLTVHYRSPALGLVAVAVSVLFLLPYLAIQMIGVGRLLEGATGGAIPYLGGTILLLVVTVVYSELGGMRAVAWTDALQGSLFFVVFYVTAAVFVVREWGSLGALFQAVAEQQPALLSVPGPRGYFTHATLISLFILIVGMPLTQPQLAIRFFVARSERTLRLMTVASATFATLVVIPALLIGLGGAARFPDLASGDLVLPTIVSRTMGPFLAGLVVCAVVASAMSTVDSQVLVLGSLLAKDGYAPVSGERDEARLLRVARLTMLVCMVAAFLIALRPVPLIIQLSLLSFAGTLQLAPAYLGALFWPWATRSGAIASVLAGVTTLGLGQWVLPAAWLLGFHPGVWGLAAGLLVLVLGSLRSSGGREAARTP